MKLFDKEKIVIIAKNKELYLFCENPEDIFSNASVYDLKNNSLTKVYPLGSFLNRGYWEKCANDQKVIEKIKKII